MVKPSEVQRLAYLEDYLAFCLHVAAQFRDQPKRHARMMRSVKAIWAEYDALAAAVEAGGEP